MKKLHIRHYNGHLDFSSGFQVTDPSTDYEKIAEILKKTPSIIVKTCWKNVLARVHIKYINRWDILAKLRKNLYIYIS